MKLLPTSCSSKFGPKSSGCPLRGSNAAFTLIEMLVAITILSILVLLFAQMLGFMSSALTRGSGRVDNFTKARAMLDLIARDLQSGIFRSDLAAFPISNLMEFYTQRPGISAGKVRYASLVQYSLAAGTTTLERWDGPVLWTDTGSALSFGSTTNFVTSAGPATQVTSRDAAPGVIAFQMVFMQADGTLSSTTFTPKTSSTGSPNANPTRVIGITLAVVDDLNLKKLSSGQIEVLASSLTSLVLPVPLHNIKATWDGYLNGPSMRWASYPKSLPVGLGTFERYVILPTTQ